MEVNLAKKEGRVGGYSISSVSKVSGRRKRFAGPTIQRISEEATMRTSVSRLGALDQAEGKERFWD